MTNPSRPSRRSFSQLKSLASCGEAYRLERIVKVPRRPAAWFTHGIAVHAAIEAYERSGRKLPEGEVIDVFEKAWADGIGKDFERNPDLSVWMTGGRRKPETDLETRYGEGREQVKAYMTYVGESEEAIWTAPDGRLAVELEIEFDLSGIPVIVYIDQVVITPNGMLLVRDLKTGSSYNSPIQLATYDLALEAEYGIRAGWGDFWLAKKAKPAPPIDLHPYTHERVGAWFATLDRAAREGIFLPNPSDKCASLCGVSQWCTAVGGTEYVKENVS
ncbi:RecB family exonuclease [Kitasatospora aureofaciens]|uniref:RecB family exonuclease n=1 Tax=Kitasatospora aureofaciens TaxID=1894 RepID=UPI0033E0E0F9